MNTLLIGDGGDNYEFLSFSYIAKENILNGKLPFSDTTILRYPVGFNFHYGMDGVVPVLLGALLSIIFDKVIAYNLTILSLFFVNTWATLFFFTKISELLGNNKNKLNILLATIMFSLAPYVIARSQGHVNLCFVAGFPIFLCGLVLILKSKRISLQDIFHLYLGALLIGLGSLQYVILTVYTLTILLPFVIFYLYYSDKLKEFLEKLLTLIKQKFFWFATLLFLSIFVLSFWGYIQAMFTGDLVKVAHSSKFITISKLDFLVPNKFMGSVWEKYNNSGSDMEKVISLGLVGTFIALVVFIKTSRIIKFCFLTLFLIYWMLSFGYLQLPNYHEGARFTLVISLFISIVILLNKTFSSKKYASLMIVLLLVERLFFTIRAEEASMLRSLEYLRQESGTAIITAPLTRYTSINSAYPVFHNKKVIDGYFHYTANSEESRKYFNHPYLSKFNCNIERVEKIPLINYTEEDYFGFVETTKVLDISHILVVKNMRFGTLHWKECLHVQQWLSFIKEQSLKTDSLEIIQSDKNFEVWKLNY